MENYELMSRVADAVAMAEEQHAEYHSLHEAYGVIAEEFKEFGDNVFLNAKKHPERDVLARREAYDLAVTAIRTIKMLNERLGE